MLSQQVEFGLGGRKRDEINTVLLILMICLDCLGPNTAGQIITRTFLGPCDSVFTGKTRAHSFGLVGKQHQFVKRTNSIFEVTDQEFTDTNREE